MSKESVRRQVAGIFLLVATVVASNGVNTQPLWKHYRGMCDASAMEMLEGDLFVAADDEDNALLNLDGQGIRSITPYDDGYLLVAGSFKGGGDASHLYQWNGGTSQPARLSPDQGLPANPEAMSVVNGLDSKILFALSDDGTVEIGNTECKKIKDKSLKTFRAFELRL